jgi:hypothetical protein
MGFCLTISKYMLVSVATNFFESFLLRPSGAQQTKQYSTLKVDI